MVRDEAPQSSSIHAVILPTIVATIGGFLFGFDSGVINGTVSSLQAAFNSSTVGTGLNVASMLLGCAAGALLAGRLADWMGRRKTLLISAVFFAVSAWGSGVAESSPEFVVYRVLGGLAVGAASILCPAYIAEIAPADKRGRLATLQQLAIVLGLFVAYLSNYLIAYVAGGAGQVWWLGYQAWQWMYWVELIPSVLFFIGLLLIPESPRFLVAIGRREQAAAVLARLGDPEHAQQEVERIQSTLEENNRPSFGDLWDSARRRIHPIVWVGIIIAAMQQFVGINVVFYYGEVLWRAAGFSEHDALQNNVITGVINITATLVALALVDRVGRRPLLIVGSAGMAIFLGVLAVVFSQGQLDEDGRLVLERSHAIIALWAANLYVVFFGISWGPVMWVLLGEIFPNQFRGSALALAGLSQWLANFLVTVTFLPLLSGIGLGGAYGIYAAFAAISCWYAWGYVRETKGKTLEEMSAD